MVQNVWFIKKGEGTTHLSWRFAGASETLSFSSVCFETLYRRLSREILLSRVLTGSTMLRLGGFGGRGREQEHCLENEIQQTLIMKIF